MSRSTDYLWDRSGAPDAEVVRLERLLGQIPDYCPVPELGPLPSARPGRGLRTLPAVALAVAATVVVVLGAAALRVWLTPWTVDTLEGTVRLGQQAVTSPVRVRSGHVIETGDGSRAMLQVGAIGRIEIAPGSRLRIVTTNRRQHRLALEHGRVSAVIDAPPRWFIVDTPAATAIDLGCAYTLEVDSAGHGTLQVREGWVQLDGGTYEAIVPEGAMAHLRYGRGPGSPYYQDASETFKRALFLIDFGSPADVDASLPVLLHEARRRDSLTLLSLLRRLDEDHRGHVYDRLVELLPAPADVTRDRVVNGDREAIDRWWKALELARPRKLYPRLWGMGS
ncbi:MAG: FecR family protein [Vicinamibacterales bacterium]